MPASTPHYAIPYQEENDPPSGDELGRDLATRVDELVWMLTTALGTTATADDLNAAVAALTARVNSNVAAIATKASTADRNWTNTNVTNLTNTVNHRTHPRGVTFTGIALNAGQAKLYTRPIPAGNTLAVYTTSITNWGVSMIQGHGSGGLLTCVFRNHGTRNLSGINAGVNYLLQ